MLTLASNAGRLFRVTRNRLTLCLLFSLLCSCGLRADSHQPQSKKTFLIVSDIHFNPMADASLVVKLAAADPEQWEAILAQSKNTAFSQYGEDTNWWLLQSALDAMRATMPYPAFIMSNGDMLAHHFPQTFTNATHDEDREDYRKFVRKTLQFLALEFRKRYPDTAIFVTPGNNDNECGNYSIYAGGDFLHDTAELTRNLAHGDKELVEVMGGAGQLRHSQSRDPRNAHHFHEYGIPFGNVQGGGLQGGLRNRIVDRSGPSCLPGWNRVWPARGRRTRKCG